MYAGSHSDAVECQAATSRCWIGNIFLHPSCSLASLHSQMLEFLTSFNNNYLLLYEAIHGCVFSLQALELIEYRLFLGCYNFTWLSTLQQTFNAHIKRAGYDLDVWRKRCNISSEEFAILDADGEASEISFTAFLSIHSWDH